MNDRSGQPRLRALAIGALVALFSLRARAESPCGTDQRPWIAVSIQGTSWDRGDAGAILGQFRTQLVGRGIDACPSTETAAPARPAPLAEVQIARQPGNQIAVEINVNDAVTVKQVRRTVGLADLPVDERPRAIAVFADELLRASWTELALRTARPPPRPVPVAVKETVSASLSPPSLVAPRLEMTAAFAATAFGGGQKQWGPEVRALFALGPSLGIGARAGYRRSLQQTSVHGTIDASTVVAGLGAEWKATPRERRAGMSALARADFQRISFFPTALPGAAATAGSLDAIVLMGGVGGWVKLGPTLMMMVEADAGWVVRHAGANDTDRGATAISGIAVEAAVGLGGRF